MAAGCISFKSADIGQGGKRNPASHVMGSHIALVSLLLVNQAMAHSSAISLTVRHNMTHDRHFYQF
jgi:hypothetical protein